jgi:hypothetical protein
MNVIPPENVKYDPYFPDLIEAYFAAGNNEKAVRLTNDYCSYNYEHLDYYLRQSQYLISSAEYEIQSAIQYTSKVSTACMTYGEKDLAEEIDRKLETYYRDYLKTRIPEDQLPVSD